MTTSKPPAGKKSSGIDINEGHFPNEINTNSHNRSDIKIVNGKKTHPGSSKSFKPLDGQYSFARDSHTYGVKWTGKERVFYFNGKELRREKNAFCHSPAPVWLSLAIIAGAARSPVPSTAPSWKSTACGSIGGSDD
jgi:hypothetical protein